MNAKHTPTPLEVFRGCSPSRIVTAYGLTNYLQSEYVGDKEKKELGDFIVRAVNSHEELLEALKNEHDNNQVATGYHEENCEVCELIAKAEGTDVTAQAGRE